MRLSSVLTIAAISTTGIAADSDDASFLTAVVSDFKEHRGDYVGYFLTAKDVPSGLTELAKQIGTYTDDSYTTLLNDDDINITSLRSFATHLTWYSRIQAAAHESGEADSASASGSASGSGSSTSSSSAGGHGRAMLIPGGALVGALAVALL